MTTNVFDPTTAPMNRAMAQGHEMRHGHALRGYYAPTTDHGITHLVLVCCDRNGPLPEPCKARADVVRHYAASRGLSAYPTAVASTVLHRLAWDAPAAGEIPRPMLADGMDAAYLWPFLSDHIWHHVAGAVILGPLCCSHPAGHRDALQAMARALSD